MKEWILSFFCLFMVSIVHANGAQGPECEGILTGRYPPVDNYDSYSIFTLADGSCWRVESIQVRYRGIWEWWTGVDLSPPERYKSTPNTWFLGSPIEIYSTNGIDLDTSNFQNEADLKASTHILVNLQTGLQSGKVLFGRYIMPEDVLAEILAVGERSGYAVGIRGSGPGEDCDINYIQKVKERFIKLTQNVPQEDYDKAFNEGFKKGRSQGYHAYRKDRDFTKDMRELNRDLRDYRRGY